MQKPCHIDFVDKGGLPRIFHQIDRLHPALCAAQRAILPGSRRDETECFKVCPATVILPESVEDQCRNTLRTIGRALTEAGFGFKDVVRVTYILPDRREFERCWPQLKAVFGDIRPPSTMFQAELIDPKMRIEIEVTAYDPAKAGQRPAE